MQLGWLTALAAAITGLAPLALAPLALAIPGAAAAMGIRPEPREATRLMALEGGLPGQWAAWKARFVAEDGRVIDTGNENVSHTEGQGFGMLLAVAYDDPVAFTRIWRWTETRLKLRGDGLFVWRWDPAANPPVQDPNSASDGDLLIAWALMRAGRKWDEPRHIAAARTLAEAIRRELVTSQAGLTVLRPGPDGFPVETPGAMVINPSYWVFPALEDLQRLDGHAAWGRLIADGLVLLDRVRMGSHGLAPDWAVLGPEGELGFYERLGPDFGYNAVRIPLYLIWAGLESEALLAPYLKLWDRPGSRPLVVDLKTDRVTQRIAQPAYDRLADLTLCVGRGDGAGDSAVIDRIGEDYYAATLALVTEIVARGRGYPCSR